MPLYDGLIFDLDGTLWDTCESCAIAWNRVLERNQIAFRPIVGEDVRRVTGKPHAECIRTVFQDLPEPQIGVLIRETMSEDNLTIDRLGGLLYPGVAAGVKQLSARYPLFIVSNCQTGYIDVFLKWSGLSSCFRDSECWGNTGLPKGDNTARLMQRNGLQKPLFIGDTEGDLQAARVCRLPFAHVTYGFGRTSDADFTVDSFAELTARLLPPT
jgi:phosphoglycolate phosphatase